MFKPIFKSILNALTMPRMVRSSNTLVFMVGYSLLCLGLGGINELARSVHC